MIVGLDLDNTITDLPEFFAVVAAGLVATGHELHVITYREAGTEAAVHAQLEQLGIAYTHLHLPAEPCDAPEWKARLARQLGLDLMIEDSPEVLARMPGSVQRLWLCDPAVFDLDACIRALREGLDGD